jgi:peptide/nickel transport system substrate-binding protein
MLRFSKIAIPIALVASSALVLSGCATTGESDAVATDTIRTTTDIPAGFDPSLSQSLPDFVLARQSFDTLVRKDDGGGVVGGIATKWETTPTSAVFSIRDDATCSDGTTITPTIVKDSFDFFMRPENKGLQPYYTFGPQLPTFAADDAAGTFTITLDTPHPDMLIALSVASTGIVCPAGIADPAGLALGSVAGAESGPYIQTAAENGVSYTYTLRSDYNAWPKYSKDLPGTPAQTLEFVVSPDSSATSNLVLSGDLDVAKIQAESMARFDGQAGYNIAVNPFSDFYVIFNERENSVFHDSALRKAVAQTIDRAALAKVTSLDTAELSIQLVQQKTPCASNDESNLIPLDAAAAAKALKGVKIRMVGAQIVGPNGAGNEFVAEKLRAAGADVTLENTDVGTWISTVFGQPDAWDMTIFADLNFVGSMANPVGNFVGPAIADGGGNIGSVNNPATLAALSASESEVNPDARCELLNTAVNELIKNADTVPLLNDAFIYVQRPGFAVTMLGGSLDDPIFRVTQ